MRKYYVVKRKELYADGSTYWNQVKSFKDKQKAIDYAANSGQHLRVFEEDFDD